MQNFAVLLVTLLGGVLVLGSCKTIPVEHLPQEIDNTAAIIAQQDANIAKMAIAIDALKTQLQVAIDNASPEETIEDIKEKIGWAELAKMGAESYRNINADNKARMERDLEQGSDSTPDWLMSLGEVALTLGLAFFGLKNPFIKAAATAVNQQRDMARAMRGEQTGTIKFVSPVVPPTPVAPATKPT